MAALPAEDFERLEANLEPVKLKHRQVLHRPRSRIEHIYFVEDGLVSVVAESPGEKPVEVWLLGREGLAGVPALLVDPISKHRRFVQVPGSALRIPTETLQKAFDESGALRNVLLRYVRAVLLQTSLIGACNSRHSLQQRLSRWVLTARDRLASDDLPFTHDMLSLMLAVRRAGVTEALAVLEREGVVEHHRGLIIIREAEGLQQCACKCYGEIKSTYDRLVAALDRDGGQEVMSGG